MRIVVVTGMSGSGKTTALRALEDAGYYAIDNLPIALLDKLVELFKNSSGEIEKLALVVDARDVRNLAQAPEKIEAARRAGHRVDLVFLDTRDEILERRYQETRRRHPLSPDGAVRDGITFERTLLDPLREAALRTVDTTEMSVHELRREILELVAQQGAAVPMGITVQSFGYKRGVPNAELLFDVRFLPNPFFVPDLRSLSGEDTVCANFVLERTETRTFLARLYPLLEFLIPQYEREGKAYLTIGVGCTGGQHRSVAIAREIGAWLTGTFPGRLIRVRHRDVVRADATSTPDIP